MPGPVRGTEDIKTSEISASGGMLSGAGLGCNRNSEEWHVAQSKRSEILTFELVDWDSGVSLLPPSPPPTSLHLLGVDRRPPVQAKRLSWEAENAL